jgi:hypothetical protein
MLTKSEIYLKAAQLIEERGLTKGNFEAPNGALCIAGACNIASGVYASPASVVGLAAWEVLEKFAGFYLVDWNDRPERTPEEVIDFLAIAAAEFEEGDTL